MDERASQGFSAGRGTRLSTDYRLWIVWWLAALGLICVLCCGCSRQTYWYRPDGTLAEAEGDCRECYRQAQVTAAEAAWDQRFDRSQIEGESTDRQWSYAYQDAQFRRCMRHNGYRLTRQRELKAPIRKRTLRLDAVQSYSIAGR
jgi:hypothetical protein